MKKMVVATAKATRVLTTGADWLDVDDGDVGMCMWAAWIR